MSVSIYRSNRPVCLSTYPSIYRYAFLSVYLPGRVSIRLSNSLLIDLPIYLCISLSVNRPVYLTIYLSVHLSICTCLLCIYYLTISICLSGYPAICPSIEQSSSVLHPPQRPKGQVSGSATCLVVFFRLGGGACGTKRGDICSGVWST